MTLSNYRSRVLVNRSRVLVLAVVAVLSGMAGIEECRSQPIDVYEPATWQRPVLIAHRGGVVNDRASENSSAAIKLAAEQEFAMIEVDVRESKDHVPVAFHDGSLLEATGVDAAIEDLSLEQIDSIRHRHTGDEILTMVERLQARGALVIPAINIFRYPSDSHMESAREDIIRMQGAGVDAFQIDAVYAPLFESDGTPTGGR